ncbi:MAG TPA: hypothetical protein VGZ91_08515 [Candidatus Sulfotelmatobacter sp.]|nr:hypothetical protein [Candidatus Sulfotelmatobacter sp.]
MIGATKTVISTSFEAYRFASGQAALLHFAIKTIEQALVFMGFGIFLMSPFFAVDKPPWRWLFGTLLSLSLLGITVFFYNRDFRAGLLLTNALGTAGWIFLGGAILGEVFGRLEEWSRKQR